MVNDKANEMFPIEPGEGAAETTPARAKKGKGGGKKKAAKPAAAKAKKAAKPPSKKTGAKAKSGVNATRTTTAPKGAIGVGTEIVYLGGSRCAWIKKGQKGVVKRYHVNPSGESFRYGVDFEHSGKTRSTQLAVKYVEKASKKAAA